MKHLRFNKSAGLSYADALAYAGALDTAFGMPRAAAQIHYSEPFANNAAQADPLSASAAWALDISINAPLAGDDGSNPATYVYPADLNANSAVPYPAGAVEWEYAPGSDAEWDPPFVL